MKSSIEASNGLKRTLKIEVDPAAVKAAFEVEFKKIQKNLVLPGFRKGKAPMDQVRAMYQGRVSSDVVESLVNQNYFAALNEHNLHPVSMPEIDFEGINEEQGFSFKATLEVKPEVKLSKYKGFELTKEAAKVDEAKIEDIIKQILDTRAEKIPVLEDRPAQNKDFVDINFEGFLSTGEPLPNGAANNFILELGSNSFIPGFEEGLVGVGVGGQKTLPLTFPEDYHASEIAGQLVNFKVTVNKIMKKHNPTLDDKFVESLNDPNVKTVAQLKENIEADLKRSEEDRINKKLQDDIFNALVESNPLELPEGLVNQQKENLKENSKQTLLAQGLGEEDMTEYYQKWDEDFTKNARNMIHASLLMDAIAEAESLRPSFADVDKKIEEMATQAGPNAARVKEYYADAGRKESLLYKLMEDRVVSFVLDNSKIKEA